MRTSKEFIKYCLVGMLNTLAGISTAYICLNLISLSYFISTAMAYVVGIIVSFYLNKKFTFKDESENHIYLFIKFVLTMLPSYIFSYTAGWEVSKYIFSLPKYKDFCLKLFTQDCIPHDKVIGNFAILISMLIYLILGFAVNKFIVFNGKNKSKA